MSLSAEVKKILPRRGVRRCLKVTERTIYHRSQGKKMLSLNGLGVWRFLGKDIHAWLAKRTERTEIAK